MDTKIIENLIDNFNIDNLAVLMRQKTRNFKLLNRAADCNIDEYFTNCTVVGEFTTTDDELEMVVFAAQVNNELSERSGKKRQYELGKRLLKDNRRYAGGFFIFYDSKGDFRFSFIHDIPQPTGKISYSNFKRYTYFVSKEQTNKTFIHQFLEANFTSIGSIVEAFSVEKVTKQFYQEVATWYFWTMDKIRFPNDYKYSDEPSKDAEIRNSTNLIRLITRIIFIWFLKEKKLVPETLFDAKTLKAIVKDFNANTQSANYYNAILQNLFFGTLNQPMNDRKFAAEGDYHKNKTEFGVKNLYRYADKFIVEPTKAIELFADIPFLNGGLFDCLDKEDESGRIVYIDGFSRNPSKQAIIPDYLFFQADEQKVNLTAYEMGRDRTFRGLIEILRSYNFTVDESTPIDQEVALDPELLGKVFEELLASYNPETASTARKATGSFYTPREIVDYMVRQSILQYFKTNTAIDEPILEVLLSFSDEVPSLTEEQRKQLIELIDNLKILDPACGSGAFPMGILHQLVMLLQKFDPENKHWYEIQYNKALAETQEAFKHSDKNEREELLKQINEAFDENVNFPDYARKLYLIENCIYGVDIQPIAVQISKLRFFISLVLDQKIDPTKENYGIRPLPNLETKFVAANTLIALEKQGAFQTENLRRIEDELKKLRHTYFTIKTLNEKKKLQEQDRKLRAALSDELQHIGYPKAVSEKISHFDPYDPNASAEWFDPEWMFGVTDGFDIVIGNPPYISTKGVDSSTKKLLEKIFGFADDTYNHFYFKGIELLKGNGILAYISSKTFWTIQTKKNLRELLLKNTILQIFDTANPFASAMVDTCVAMVQKKLPNQNHVITFLDGRKDLLDPAYYTVLQNIYATAPNKVIFIPTDHNMKVYERLAKKVNDLLNQWWDAISTSKNIEKNKRQLEEYRRNLKTGDITLLGLITEGGQGLATANNGKYIGVLDGTKWAENVRKQRPEKLLEASTFCQQNGIQTKQDAQYFLDRFSEKEIRNLFDEIKVQYGRDIFGQGFLYRIISKDEVADIEGLTEDEKLNGIAGPRTFVPYDKGDKDGNRWYAPTPYYIDWSKENVKFLKENSGKKGEGMPVVRNPQFYFREGFCWTDVNSTYLKARVKENGVYDVLTMSLFTCTQLPDWYFVCLINSKFISEYVDDFINSTSHFQINDARQLPIIIPTHEQLKQFEAIFSRAYAIQKEKFAGKVSEKEAEGWLAEVQRELDEMVEGMYMGG